jgi:predicted nucleic acid-binding protein
VPTRVFVDSGAWIAVAMGRDAHHRAAAEQYRKLLAESRTLITTNLVVAESYLLIRRAGGHQAAIQFLEALRASPRLTRLYAFPELDDVAEQILIRYADQDFSYVDAVSFAVMRSERIDEAFAFDHHFLTAGFTLIPGQH